MTEKEIYKARAEGLNKIANIHLPVSDVNFLEFINYVREIAEQNRYYTLC